MNVGRKISSYTKALGLSMLVGLSSCGKKEVKTGIHFEADSIKTSTGKLIAMLERGDRHAVKVINSPKGTRVLTAEEIWNYAPNDSVGETFYKVYAGKADKAIRKARREKGTLVTVGQGVARVGNVELANGQKAYEGDFISFEMADSLANRAINQKDSILRANIADSTYSKLKNYEKDPVIAYLYNVNENILKKAPKGKSFFEFLSEGSMGMVQSKFNITPSAESAKPGIAKRNLVKLIIFGNGKIYEEKAAQDNFVKQVKAVKKHKKGNSLLKEVIDLVQKYGVDSLSLVKTKEEMFKIK